MLRATTKVTNANATSSVAGTILAGLLGVGGAYQESLLAPCRRAREKCADSFPSALETNVEGLTLAVALCCCLLL